MSIRLLPLLLLAVLLGPVSAFACVDDDTTILFGSTARERERQGEECQDNGLNPGSYFDEKGRIVGSPCDPVQYCSDPSSEDIAVVDYCSDTWNEQGIDRSKSLQEKCEARGNVWEDNGCTYHIDCEEYPIYPSCNDNDIPKITPSITPTPEPEIPAEDCRHEGDAPDVCRPVIEDEDNEDKTEEQEEEIRAEEDSTVESESEATPE